MIHLLTCLQHIFWWIPLGWILNKILNLRLHCIIAKILSHFYTQQTYHTCDKWHMKRVLSSHIAWSDELTEPTERHSIWGRSRGRQSKARQGGWCTLRCLCGDWCEPMMVLVLKNHPFIIHLNVSLRWRRRRRRRWLILQARHHRAREQKQGKPTDTATDRPTDRPTDYKSDQSKHATFVCVIGATGLLKFYLKLPIIFFYYIKQNWIW